MTHGFALRWNQFRTIDVPDAASTSAYAINGHGDIVGLYVSGMLTDGGQFGTVDLTTGAHNRRDTHSGGGALPGMKQ